MFPEHNLFNIHLTAPLNKAAPITIMGIPCPACTHFSHCWQALDEQQTGVLAKCMSLKYDSFLS